MASGQVDFEHGDIRRNVLAVAAPMLVAQIVNLLYNIIDRIYIGKIPGEGMIALAGIGLCFPVITMITAFANLFGLGGAPLCSIARGKKDFKTAGKIMNHGFVMLLITGSLLILFGLLFHKPILFLFGASPTTFPYASKYMRIYLLGTIFVMIALGMNPYINSQGFAKIGMKTVAVGAISNIVLDPVFIFGFHMGVSGAALATIISQMFSAVWVLLFLTGKKAELSLSLRSFQFDGRCVLDIVKLGSSTFVMSFTNGLVQIACNSTLNQYGGDIYISAMTVINSVREIAETPVIAVTNGSSPVIGYNFGAEKYDAMKKAVRFMTQLCVVYSLIIWGAISLFPEGFIRIFNQDINLLKVTVPALHIYFFGFFMMAFQHAGQCVFKALNKAAYAVFFSIFRKAIIVVPLVLLLPKIPALGVLGVFMAEPISNFVGGAICYLTMQLKVLRKL